MTFQQKLLTGFLLVLTGMMIGMITMIYVAGINNLTQTEVRIADVKRSVGFSDDAGLSITSASASASASASTSASGSASTSGSASGLGGVAKNVTPSVVYIETIVAIEQTRSPHRQLEDEEGNLLDRFLPRRRGSSIGSGVLISPDGYIITNNHVISGAEKSSITVGLSDKRTFPATVIGSDPTTDLAVIKVDANDLPAIIIGNSDQLNVGDLVVAIGNPFRLRSTVTAGIVSALDRNVDIINDQMRIESFIQTDAAINRGNSGGALINEYGELVGINTAIATENGAYQGYGFAIPINMAFKIARDIIEFGEVQRAYLGVQIQAVDQDRASQLGMYGINGVEIVNLVKNSAASQAGLLVNDVILSVNGSYVNESNELQAKIALHRPGEEVILNIWREGNIISLNTKLAGLDNAQIRSWLGR
jgi:Do/DeqQ family serine protease